MKKPRDLSDICQVGIVVKDLDAAMAKYRAVLGIEHFNVFTVDSGAVEGNYYRGEPARWVARYAKAKIGGWELELVEHLSGESIYKEFLEKKGEGLHHLGVEVDDYPACQEKLIGAGYGASMGGPIYGKYRGGRYDYYETEDGLATIIELLDIPEGFGQSE